MVHGTIASRPTQTTRTTTQTPSTQTPKTGQATRGTTPSTQTIQQQIEAQIRQQNRAGTGTYNITTQPNGNIKVTTPKQEYKTEYRSGQGFTTGTYTPYTAIYSPTGQLISEKYKGTYKISAGKKSYRRIPYTKVDINYKTGYHTEQGLRSVGKHGRQTLRTTLRRTPTGTRTLQITNQYIDRKRADKKERLRKQTLKKGLELYGKAQTKLSKQKIAKAFGLRYETEYKGKKYPTPITTTEKDLKRKEFTEFDSTRPTSKQIYKQQEYTFIPSTYVKDVKQFQEELKIYEKNKKDYEKRIKIWEDRKNDPNYNYLHNANFGNTAIDEQDVVTVRLKKRDDDGNVIGRKRKTTKGKEFGGTAVYETLTLPKELAERRMEADYFYLWDFEWSDKLNKFVKVKPTGRWGEQIIMNDKGEPIKKKAYPFADFVNEKIMLPLSRVKEERNLTQRLWSKYEFEYNKNPTKQEMKRYWERTKANIKSFGAGAGTMGAQPEMMFLLGGGHNILATRALAPNAFNTSIQPSLTRYNWVFPKDPVDLGFRTHVYNVATNKDIRDEEKKIYLEDPYWYMGSYAPILAHILRKKGRIVQDKRFISADTGEMVPLRDRIKQVETILDGTWETAITSRSHIGRLYKSSNQKDVHNLDHTYNVPHQFASYNVGKSLPTSDIFLSTAQGRKAGQPIIELYKKGKGVEPIKLTPEMKKYIKETLLKGESIPNDVNKWLYEEAQRQATEHSKTRGYRVLVATISPKRSRGFEQPELEMSLVHPKGNFRNPVLLPTGIGPKGSVILEQGLPNPKNLLPIDHVEEYFKKTSEEKLEYLRGDERMPREYQGHGYEHLVTRWNELARNLGLDPNKVKYDHGHDLAKIADADSFSRYNHGEITAKQLIKGTLKNWGKMSLIDRIKIANAFGGHEYYRPTIASLFQEAGGKGLALPSGKQIFYYATGLLNADLRRIASMDRMDLTRFGLEVDQRMLAPEFRESQQYRDYSIMNLGYFLETNNVLSQKMSNRLRELKNIEGTPEFEKLHNEILKEGINEIQKDPVKKANYEEFLKSINTDYKYEGKEYESQYKYQRDYERETSPYSYPKGYEQPYTTPYTTTGKYTVPPYAGKYPTAPKYPTTT